MFGKDLICKNKTEVQEKTSSFKTFMPEVDIYEKSEALFLVADGAGGDKKDVEINLKDNVLSIKGQIKAEGYQGLRPLYGEYNIGHYERRFNLSEKIDQEKVQAQMDNGTLTLTLPKAQAAKARSIVIQ